MQFAGLEIIMDFGLFTPLNIRRGGGPCGLMLLPKSP